jgi:hypothetical protein
MGRIGLVLSVIDLLLTVVAIVDIVLIDPSRVRGLPKWAWVVVALLLFIVGPGLWFTIGRIRLEPRAASGPLAPDDDPDFLRGLGEQHDKPDPDSRPDDQKPRG